MTIERQDILEDYYAGDYKELVVVVYEKDGITLKDLTDCEITYALFDDDYRPYIMKSSNNGISEIEITDVPNGEVTVKLQGTDSLHLDGRFRHQMEVADANEKPAMAMTGKVNIFRAIARRYRTAVAIAYLAGG